MPSHRAVEDADEVLRAASATLVRVTDEVLAGWVRRSVAEGWRRSGAPPDPAVAAAADRAAVEAVAEVGQALRALLELDIDAQTRSPLMILRQAVRYPTEVLAAAGVVPVARDAFDMAHFPDDVYGLTPLRFGDVDPALEEPGLVWGAAKAHRHLARHREAT